MCNIITFIIPTIGRTTLERSIESILNQSFDIWYIIIIFDGIKSTLGNKYINDKRINIYLLLCILR